MDTQQTQHNPTDPKLDALLDEALSCDSFPADPLLADRIIERTLPMLGRPSVLARLGPTLLRVAAAVLIVVGAGVVATVVTRDPAQPTDTNTIAQIDSVLRQIAQTNEPGNTLIDEQLDMLALRVDYASADGVWGGVGQDTNDRLEDAVTRFQFDRLSDDAMLLSNDGEVLF